MLSNHYLSNDEYYFVLFSTLISHFNAGLSYPQVAAKLNQAAILSPSRKPFTAEAVKQLIKRVRNHSTYPSAAHRSLLKLIETGRIIASDALALFEPRRGI